MYRNHEVLMIRTSFFPFINYTYLIIDKATKNIALVDPAWEMNKISSAVDSIGGKLTAVLLTHSHYDHTNLVNSVLKYYDPMIYMSKRETDYYKFKCRNLNAFNDLDTIPVGETEIKCIVTPGHTNGGACYLVPDSIFTGDTIFIEGCGMCDTKGGDAGEMYESVQRIKTLVNSDTQFFPSHTFGKQPGSTYDQLLVTNVYFHIENKDKFVEFRMSRNKSNLFSFK